MSQPILQRCQKGQKCVVLLCHTLFPRNFSGTITDRDITNTLLEPLRPADVPFGGFVDIASHLGVKSTENPNFGGVHRRFQTKRAIYWKFHIFETPASISTKFCTTMETIKWSSWVVPIGAQQIQDGGRPPFWKKTVKSPYLCNRLTDFDEIWHSDTYWPPAGDRP